MMILSGRHPLTSRYFLKAFITAGFMVLSSSEFGESWRLAEEMNLVRDWLRLATRAPTDLDLCMVSW